MNLPNKLTVLRIILIPLMIFFYLANFIPFGKIIAIILFITAAITDLFDGKIARKRNIVTDFGKIADPIADKLLSNAALLLVICDGTVPSPWGLIAIFLITARDLLITTLRGNLMAKGIYAAAEKLGKVKTGVTLTVLPILMFVAFWNQYNFFNLPWLNLTFSIIGWTGLAVVVILTMVSCFTYTIKYSKHFISK